MKKIYLFAASLILTAGAMAQTNLGFETWAPGVTPMTPVPHPTGWESSIVGAVLPGAIDNDLAAFGATITIGGVAGAPTTQSTAAPSEGTSNVSLQTFTISGLTGQNAALNGIHGSSVSQMMDLNSKSPGVSFQYKSNLVAGDKALVFITVYGAGIADSVIGQAVKLISTNQAAWKLDTAKITYFSTSTIVDSIEIIFSSCQNLLQGAPTPATDGSLLQVDDVKILAAPAYASAVSNIVATDISDNGNGTDLKVTFNAAANETTVSEYRLFVIKSGYTGNWNALTSAYYEVVAKSGASSYTHVYTAPSICLGVSGGSLLPYAIKEDSLMQIYVLSVADGTNATVNQIAGPSNSIMLTSGAGITNLSLANNEVRVYPNPARNMVNFAFENNNMATEVKVFNMTGQLISSVQVSTITTVDLSNADSGMYIYQIVGNNNEIIKTDKFQVVK